METPLETQRLFRKLQLDTSIPLQRHHAGSSSLSLSLSGAGSRSGLASTSRVPSATSSATQSPTPTPPISVRPLQIQQRPTDSFSQCTDSPELSSSGRYAQSNFTLSPLERASRADSASLFEQFASSCHKLEIPRSALGLSQQQLQRQQQQQPTSKNIPTIVQDGEKLLFEKKPLPVRSNTESETFNYDFSSGRPRRAPTSGIGNGLVSDRDSSLKDNNNATGSLPGYRAVEPTVMMHDPRRRFLSPSPFEKMIEDQDRMSSLTSSSTVGSPLSEALATPTDSECSDMYGPAIAHTVRSQSFQDAISLGETSAWPRDLVMAHRNRSYNFEVAQPQGPRRKRRAFSERKLSPANQFLSGWSCQKAAEPDDEGQEVGAYVIGKQVGYGGFSVVKEAVTMKNGMKIKRAVKIVRKKAHNKECENERIQAEFEHEVSIWRYLSHPHILPLIEVYDSPFATYCFTKLTTNGTLFDLVKANRQGLPAHLAAKFAYQLASAIRYLHEDVRIIHRDIKLENCLIDVSVDPEGALLLCDFGMAEQIPGSNDDDSDSDNSSFGPHSSRSHIRKGPPETSTSITGSLQYAPPEMMSCTTPRLSTAVDMWAFGVVVYALHTGILPFNHAFQPKLQMMIARGDWDVERFRNATVFQDHKELGKMALDVVKGCLCKQPENRWTVGMVLDSKWLSGFTVESP
ncbi:kinase-like domain-containing protein [Kalaharituber pfeilii]|nr:kinase-like domain-containing protein [Kalaharituber pfeilii]